MTSLTDLQAVSPEPLAVRFDEDSFWVELADGRTLGIPLAAAVDYGVVARRIVQVGTEGRVNLLERLAGLIAQALLREFPAHEVRVRVRKLTPPMEGLVGTPGVEIVRRRAAAW